MKKIKVYYNISMQYRFLPYKLLKDYDYNITLSDYELVFNGNTEQTDIDMALNETYELFNDSYIVEKLQIRSLSVSDVIEIDNRYFYVDSIGFEEISL